MTTPRTYGHAVVIGGALYAGRWHKDARRFVRREREALRTSQVWLFSSGPTGAEPSPGVGVSERQLTSLRQTLHPRDHRQFSGALDPKKLGFLERQMVKAVKAPTGDFRDWVDIEAYAEEIAGALNPT